MQDFGGKFSHKCSFFVAKKQIRYINKQKKAFLSAFYDADRKAVFDNVNLKHSSRISKYFAYALGLVDEGATTTSETQSKDKKRNTSLFHTTLFHVAFFMKDLS